MVKKYCLYVLLFVLIASFTFAQSEYYYNTSDFGNKSTYAEILLKANEYTMGWYGTGILIGYLIVAFAVSRKLALSAKDAATVAFFSASLIGMLMIPLKIVKLDALIYIIVLFVVGLITIFWD